MEKPSLWLYAIISLLVTVCVIGFGRMTYGITMPFMRESLSLTYEQAGYLGMSTSVGYLAMVLIVGLLATRWGSKKLVMIGLILLGIGFISLFYVNNYVISLIVMGLIGIGSAFSYTTMINILVGWFPDNRGLMVGFMLSGTSIGTFIASILIPIYSEWSMENGWRYLWLLCGVITFIIFILFTMFLKDSHYKEPQKVVERFVLIKEVFLHKETLILGVLYSMIGFAYLIPANFLFSYMLESGLENYTVGIIIGLSALLGVISGLMWGVISDRVGRYISLIIVLFLNALSVFIIISFSTIESFILSQFIWGLTQMGTFNLIQVLATEQSKAVFAPVTLGYVTVFFAFGQILGPGLGGILIERFESITAAFWLCGILFGVAFIVSIYLKVNNTISKGIQSRSV